MINNINYKNNFQPLYSLMDIVGVRENNKNFISLNNKTSELLSNKENQKVFNQYDDLLEQKKGLITLDYYIVDNNEKKFYMINKIPHIENNSLKYIFFWGCAYRTIPLNFIFIKTSKLDISIELLDKLSLREKKILWFIIFKFEPKLIAKLANTTVAHVFNTKQKIKNIFNVPSDTLICNENFIKWIQDFHTNFNIENTSLLLEKINM